MAITKQHTASLISTLNTGKTKKIQLFYTKNACFIHNFTYIEKRVKCRIKIYLPKVLESMISKPRLISDYFNTRSYLAQAEKYLDKSRFGKQYFPPLG